MIHVLTERPASVSMTRTGDDKSVRAELFEALQNYPDIEICMSPDARDIVCDKYSMQFTSGIDAPTSNYKLGDTVIIMSEVPAMFSVN